MPINNGERNALVVMEQLVKGFGEIKHAISPNIKRAVGLRELHGLVCPEFSDFANPPMSAQLSTAMLPHGFACSRIGHKCSEMDGKTNKIVGPQTSCPP